MKGFLIEGFLEFQCTHNSKDKFLRGTWNIDDVEEEHKINFNRLVFHD